MMQPVNLYFKNKIETNIFSNVNKSELNSKVNKRALLKEVTLNYSSSSLTDLPSPVFLNMRVILPKSL